MRTTKSSVIKKMMIYFVEFININCMNGDSWYRIFIFHDHILSFTKFLNRINLEYFMSCFLIKSVNTN